jgi:hypothetical protein
MADSVPIAALIGTAPVVAAPASAAAAAPASIRNLVIIFVLFLLVVSDFFTNNIISKIGKKTMNGRTPTAFGVVLQGTALTILYALMTYLESKKLL